MIIKKRYILILIILFSAIYLFGCTLPAWLEDLFKSSQEFILTPSTSGEVIYVNTGVNCESGRTVVTVEADGTIDMSTWDAGIFGPNGVIGSGGLNNCAYGCLMARIDDYYFFIGEYYRGLVQRSGELELFINTGDPAIGGQFNITVKY